MRRRLVVLLVLGLIAAGLWLCHAHLAPATTEGVTRMADLGLVLLDSETGVSVLAVKDKSPADHAGIHPGDLLLQADGQPFDTILQLEAMLPSPRPPAMHLQLMRHQEEIMTVKLSLE